MFREAWTQVNASLLHSSASATAASTVNCRETYQTNTYQQNRGLFIFMMKPRQGLRGVSIVDRPQHFPGCVPSPWWGATKQPNKKEVSGRLSHGARRARTIFLKMVNVNELSTALQADWSHPVLPNTRPARRKRRQISKCWLPKGKQDWGKFVVLVLSP